MISPCDAVDAQPEDSAASVKLSDLRTNDELVAEEMADPAFRAEWERTAVAHAVALRLVAIARSETSRSVI